MITFRYKKELGRNREIIKRPVADVFLHTKQGSWIEFHPYIDSGADITLIPLSFGKLLGFTIDEKNIEQIGGIRGSVPVIYLKNKIKISGNEFLINLGWALVEEVPPLLGRAQVFDFFTITFKQTKDIILFEKVS